MTSVKLSKALRALVSAQARHRYGYCLTAEAIVGTPMEIDHIIPRALGGPTEEDNLWLACSLCNDHKGDQIAAADPLSGELVRLFDPRHEIWSEHFAWTEEGDRIVGLTPSGRATVVAYASIAPRWSQHDRLGSLLGGTRLWTNDGRVGCDLLL